MKTKTIYHLDQDCNVVRIEIITKKQKKKKRPMIMNIERMIENVVITKEELNFVKKIEERITTNRLQHRKNLDDLLHNSEALKKASSDKENTTNTLQLHNRVISQNQKDYADFFEAEHQLVEYLKAHVGRTHFGTSLTYLLPMRQAFLSINDSNKELHSSQYLSYKLNKEHCNAAVSSAEGDLFSEM